MAETAHFEDLPLTLHALGLREVRERIAEWVRVTPLVPAVADDVRVDLRLKLENRQVTGSFKARGATNHALSAGGDRGLVTSSSGNHGKAVAWAAAHRGIAARVHMPANSYPSKVQACRDLGAEVVLSQTRAEAEEAFRRSVEEGWTPAPPYDSELTVAGQASVGLEVLEQWPRADVLVVPVGGGGLLAGCALAFATADDGRTRRVVGVEPEGAAGMRDALPTGVARPLARVDSVIQGLTPPGPGVLNARVAHRFVERVDAISDEAILRAQARLVHELGEDVEPAGAAAYARVLAGLPEAWFEGRREPLRVVAIVSGGNAHPHQLARLREDDAEWLLPDGGTP
ncbi:MAG: pyridoxal-phosphate dependent enzyme [Planctomycetota bacterium]